MAAESLSQQARQKFQLARRHLAPAQWRWKLQMRHFWAHHGDKAGELL
jgi:hypothetical protein